MNAERVTRWVVVAIVLGLGAYLVASVWPDASEPRPCSMASGDVVPRDRAGECTFEGGVLMGYDCTDGGELWVAGDSEGTDDAGWVRFTPDMGRSIWFVGPWARMWAACHA